MMLIVFVTIKINPLNMLLPKFRQLEYVCVLWRTMIYFKADEMSVIAFIKNESSFHDITTNLIQLQYDL